MLKTIPAAMTMPAQISPKAVVACAIEGEAAFSRS
jgi:hypothetical protein